MEQHQFEVSFSLGTKLLVSIVPLLLVFIIFLSVSAILLFREDKKAYIYQTQSTESVLTGKEFVVLAKHSIDTLRTSLATINPKTAITTAQTDTIQALVDNQSEIFTTWIVLAQDHEKKLVPYANISKKNHEATVSFKPDDYKLSEETLLGLMSDLVKNGFIFLNVSKLGQTPTIAIGFADLSLRNSPEGMPIAFGIVPLKEFASGLNSLKITIGTLDGRILFDTDPTLLFSNTNISKHPLFQSAKNQNVVSGTLEYNHEGKHYLGSFVLPGLNLIVMSKVEWFKALAAIYVLTERLFLLGSMAVGIAIVFAILFSETLTAPLERLYLATKEVGEGRFVLHLEERGKDEISVLSRSFNTMSKKIEELIEEQIEKVRLQNEMNIASTVQQTLIPPNSIENSRITIKSHYQAASTCGGDWWGFFEEKNKAVMMIADATGHGLPSALITAAARSCFSLIQKIAQEDDSFSFSPGLMLAYANRVIYEASLSKIMMTFFIAVADLEANKLTFASAGHNPPWFFKKEEDKFKLISLVATGQRLGEDLNSPPFEEKTIDINPMDILFLYTDGLIEGKNLQDEQYGKKKARNLVQSLLPDGPQSVIDNVMSDFLKYNEGKQLDDDVTIAAIQFHEPRAVAEKSSKLDDTPVKGEASEVPDAPVQTEVTGGHDAQA